MKKTILKTVTLTLVSIVALCLITYGCVAGSSPKSLASVWSDLGSYDISVKYYEKQYEKTQDFSDLVVLCNKVNEQKDSALSVTYLKALTEDENFSGFCETEDGGGGYTFTTYEYYFGKYAVAVYYDGGIDSAIAVAENSVSAGYTEHSAFYSLLGIESLTETDGKMISSTIEKLKSSLSDNTQKAFAERDIKLADSIR